MLHGVLAAFVSKYGYNEGAFTSPDGTEGNVQYLHLFIDALSLQPCNPTRTSILLSARIVSDHAFECTVVQARDAWIQADVNRYAGANACLIWNAFADRGLGVNAANYEDDSSVPAGC